ncbi:MAG TPA: hypothetical protein VF911_20380, partial [Thermoanaerobaculia bacterium]
MSAAARTPPRLRELMRERPVWLLTLLVLGYFYVPLTTGTLYFRDLYRVLYPKRVFFAAAIRSGEFPLWDPMTHGGVPFLAYPSNYALYPANVLYAFLPTLLAFNLMLVLQVLLCALAGYWLACVVGTSRTAAFIAGLALAFCGYTLSSTNLLPVLLGLPWIPLTLGLAIRAVRHERSLIPAAIAAAMPLYGGAAEVSGMLYATLAVWLLTERSIRPRQRVVALASIVLGGIGLSLLVTLPATSVIAQSSRAHAQPYSDFAAWSVAPQRLPELVVPRFLGDTDTLVEERRWGRNLTSNGYPLVISIYCGIPLLLLAIGGARRNAFLAAIALLALIASLGGHLPGFRLIHEYVPFVSTFRYPVKAQVAALVPLVILAAFGLDVLRESERLRKRTMLAATVVGAAAVVVAALLAYAPSFAAAFARAFSFTPLDAAMRNMLALSFIHTALVSLCFAAAVASRRQAAIAVVIAADLLIAGLSAADFAPREIFSASPLAAAARQVTADGRFYAAGQPLTISAPDDDLMWLARWQIA